MAKFEFLESLGPKEYEKYKIRADFKLFVKQCHPIVQLLKTVRLETVKVMARCCSHL